MNKDCIQIFVIIVSKGIKLWFIYAGDAPNYFPNSFSGPQPDKRHLEPRCPVTGDVARYESGDDDNFTQVGIFYRDVSFFSIFLICNTCGKKYT